MPVSRRRFLQLAGGSLAAFVASCTRDTGSSTTLTASSGAGSTTPGVESTTTIELPPLNDAISVWEEVRGAVRMSPDHLAERATEVAGSGDPAAIFAFVRDNIRTLAPTDGLSQALQNTRWGTDAVLRSGAGTPREKADLLVGLLQTAGFDASVAQGRMDPAIDPAALLGVGIPPPFKPVVQPERVDHWLSILGVSEVGPFSAFDLDRRSSKPIADDVLTSLPAGLTAAPYDHALGLIPLVEVTVDGATLYANPLVTGAQFGEPYADQINVAPPASPPGDVEIELSVAMSANPAARKALVTAAWPVPRLVGRQVIARFVPEGEPEVTLFTPAHSLRTFTGVLVLEDPHVAIGELPDDVVIGSTVTTSGDVIEALEDGMTVNGLPFVAEPVSGSAIASLEISLSAAAFPHIRLRVGAFDASGEPVMDVPADALSIIEDGVSLPFVVPQNRPPSPRVLFLLDTSGSIPPEFIGDNLATLVSRVAEDVVAAHNNAEFLIGGVANGAAGVAHLWTRDIDEISLEAGRVVGYGSEFVAAAADARFHAPNLVVLITDGQSTDIEEELVQAWPQIAAGPPIISLLVGEPDTVVPQEMARLSGGEVYTTLDHDSALAAILGHLAERDVQPLEIEYEAPDDGPDQRSVELKTATVTSKATYTVPTPLDRLDPPAISGIYLTVRMGGTEVVRTLAGIPFENASAESMLDPATRLEVRAALLGSTMLSVEGSAPTMAAWLDDILTARLTWGPLFELARTGSTEAHLAAIVSGVKQVPGELMLLHCPFDNPSIFEVAPRMVLLSRRPTWDGGDIRRADILPFTKFASPDPDRAEAFKATVAATARLAAAEAHLYQDSTASRLEGGRTTYLPASGVAPREGPLADRAVMIDLYGDRERLVGGDATFAMWAVDHNGTLLGIMPDGSGGGSSESQAEDQCKTINQGAAVSDVAGAFLGLPGVYGAFVALQKAIIKQYIKQAAKVAAIGGDLPDVKGCGGAGDFPCDVAKDWVFGAIPGGSLLGGVDKVVAAATGDDAFNC